MDAYIITGVGDHILHELEFRNWNQKTFADAMEITEKHASKLINNQVQLSDDMAIKLSHLFSIPAKTWLSIDNEYRLSKLNEKKFVCTATRGELYSLFPIGEMKKLGWIDSEATKTEDLKNELTHFTQTEDFNVFDSVNLNMAARTSECYNEGFNLNFAKIWYKKALLESSNLNLPEYNSNLLESLLHGLKEFTQSSNGVKMFILELEKCGVGFLYLPHLSHTYLDGAAFYRESNPFVVYTARYDRLDNFWFTVLHELGHIFKGHVTQTNSIIDSEDFKKDQVIEIEADQFARQKIGIDKVLSLVKDYTKVPGKLLNNMLELFDYLHPSIIIGALQYQGKISYRYHNKYKEKVKYLLT